MATAQIDRILKVYKSVVKNPSLTSARIEHIGETRVVVQSSWSQRDLELRDTHKFGVTYTLKPDLQLFEGTSFSIDKRLQLACAYTEDGKKKAELRSAVVENKTKQFIHIWEGPRWVQNYDLSALDVHGDVYTDVEFGSFQWSPDGTKLLYIAEKKLPKSEPFGKTKPLEKKAKKDDDQVPVGEEYVFKPHWGEQLVGKHRPVVVVLDTTTERITVQPGIPDDLSPGQVIWTPEGDGIVGAALKHEPRYLGLYACSNRASWIFLLKNGSYRNLSENGCAVRSPRFSLDGKHLVWLEREAGGPHHNAHRIMHLKWEPQLGKTDVILDIVRTSKAINFGAVFHGFFNRGFPKRCWSNDSKYLFFSTPQRFNVRSYALNIESKTLTEIENDSTSLSIVDVCNDVVLFHRQSLLESSSLWIGKFDEKTLGKIERNVIFTPEKISGFENFRYEVLEHEDPKNEKVREFNSMYFGPKAGQDKSFPLVIFAHGGPHSSYSNMFSLECSLLALLGYGVLQINYRGSTGMGADNVEFLQGRVGDVDVKDCVAATKAALAKYPWLDDSRVGLCGGSHGGFLSAHLSGQYRDFFKAVSMRNPVIDLAAMFTISDIPDCRNSLTKDEIIAYRHDVCAAETGVAYKENEPAMDSQDATDMVVKMFKCSPIIHVDKVKAPTLVCIGTNDYRVPPSQGKHWYHRLKANGVNTKMLVYEDNHSLASGTTEIDFVVNTAIWFENHLRGIEEMNSVSMDTSATE